MNVSARFSGGVVLYRFGRKHTEPVCVLERWRNRIMTMEAHKRWTHCCRHFSDFMEGNLSVLTPDSPVDLV